MASSLSRILVDRRRLFLKIGNSEVSTIESLTMLGIHACSQGP
jgi:hypothetical protein